MMWYINFGCTKCHPYSERSVMHIHVLQNKILFVNIVLYRKLEKQVKHKLRALRRRSKQNYVKARRTVKGRVIHQGVSERKMSNKIIALHHHYVLSWKIWENVLQQG